MTVQSFYKRALPSPPALEFASPQGKELFREALLNGTMEGFFNLISYYQTQSEPAFCGLTSLSIVLNALSIDPGRKWKGPWRWFDETMLDCCEPLEKVKIDGITFGKLVCLANCAGAKVEAFRSNQSSLEDFRKYIEMCAASENCHLIVSYHRGILKQTGTGHFSPIGGYHAGKDMALILDVARFKYPPHWVPLSLLWEAMGTKDEETQYHRGFMKISKRKEGPSLLYTLSCKHESWQSIAQYLLEKVPYHINADGIDTVENVLSAIIGSFPADPSEFIKWIMEISSLENCETELPNDEVERLTMKKEILLQIRATEMYDVVNKLLLTTTLCCGSQCSLTENPSSNSIQNCPAARDLVTVLLLGLPHQTWEAVHCKKLQKELLDLVSPDNFQRGLQEEILHLRRQLLYVYTCYIGKLEEDFQEPLAEISHLLV